MRRVIWFLVAAMALAVLGMMVFMPTAPKDNGAVIVEAE